MVLEYLHVGAKLKLHSIVVWIGVTGNECRWTEVVGDAVFLRELVQASNGIGLHVSSHDLWDALKWQSVHARAEALLDCPDGPFHFSYVAVGGDYVELHWAHVVTDALELMVGMNGGGVKTTRLVKLEDRVCGFEHGGFAAVGNGLDGAIPDVAQNMLL